ncbi:MAG TPA: cytochrome c oxidase assembly protein [Xanthobacteraceae bacterium]
MSDISPKRNKNALIAGMCGVWVAAMVGAAYASVPLYNWFCRTTGFGGTPQIATAEPSHVLGRKLTVRFDANTAGGLPWQFAPEQNSLEVKVGEVVTVDYVVVNQSARDTVGIASYNVSPPTVGAYFSKINCFCFSEQRLKPGEKRHMTVVFFVDPEIAKDSEQDNLDTITLSYTMYPARQPERSQRQSGAVPDPGRS